MTDKIAIERETLERAIDALGPVGGSKARIATPTAGRE